MHINTTNTSINDDKNDIQSRTNDFKIGRIPVDDHNLENTDIDDGIQDSSVHTFDDNASSFGSNTIEYGDVDFSHLETNSTRKGTNDVSSTLDSSGNDFEEQERYSEYHRHTHKRKGHFGLNEIAARSPIAAIVLGNILTLVIVSLVILNVKLFYSYIGVLFYSWLIAESLWSFKLSMLSTLVYLNDDQSISPRDALMFLWDYPIASIFKNEDTGIIRWNRLIWISSMFFLTFSTLATFPFAMGVITTCCAVVIGFAFVLDRKLLVLCRLHRYVLDDHTYVALIIILVMVISVTIVASSFVLLSIRDAMTAVEVVTASIGSYLDDDATEQIWVQVTTNGKSALKSWVDSVEGQYKHTGWEPIVNWVAQTVQDHHLHQDAALFSFVNDTTPNPHPSSTNIPSLEWDGTLEHLWPAIQTAIEKSFPEWNSNMTLLELGTAVYNNPGNYMNQQVLELPSKFQGVLTGAYAGIMNTSAIILSLLLSLIDMGVRVGFLLCVLFFLLSSKENLLHTLLKEFSDEASPTNNQQPKSPVLKFELKLRKTIEGVLMLPFKMAILHAFATFTLFYSFNADFVFFASSLSIVFTLFPVVYPYWISLPWCIIYMYRGYVLSSITMQVLHYLMLAYIDEFLLSRFQMKRFAGINPEIQSFTPPPPPKLCSPAEIRRSSSVPETQSFTKLGEEPISEHTPKFDRSDSDSPTLQRQKSGSSTTSENGTPAEFSKTNYITGLSLFFGVNAFGAQGILLGPLLVCLAIVTYETMLSHVKAQQKRALISTPRSVGYPIGVGMERRRSSNSSSDRTGSDTDFSVHGTPISRGGQFQFPDTQYNMVAHQIRQNKQYPLECRSAPQFYRSYSLPDELHNQSTGNFGKEHSRVYSAADIQEFFNQKLKEEVLKSNVPRSGRSNTVNVRLSQKAKRSRLSKQKLYQIRKKQSSEENFVKSGSHEESMKPQKVRGRRLSIGANSRLLWKGLTDLLLPDCEERRGSSSSDSKSSKPSINFDDIRDERHYSSHARRRKSHHRPSYQ